MCFKKFSEMRNKPFLTLYCRFYFFAPYRKTKYCFTCPPRISMVRPLSTDNIKNKKCETFKCKIMARFLLNAENQSC